VKQFIDQTFIARIDRDSAAVLEEMSFEHCVFINCCLSVTKDVRKRSTVRNVRLRGCRFESGVIGPAVLNEVVIDGLSSPDLILAWSPFFRHVALRNRVGAIRINKVPHFSDYDPKMLVSFDRARAEFYAATDWAIDISEAEFQEFSVRGIPAHLIRRDPATQVIVSREKAADTSWRDKVASWNSHWPMVIDMALEDGEPAVILFAPRATQKKRYQKLVDGLQNLRDIGVAEPD